jgi:hypothetical protein
MASKTLLAGVVMALSAGGAFAQEAFETRGVLPWHNFLSGPSAWEEADYREYLDQLAADRLNYIVFHCYTGGAERYAPYVEPMIRLCYRNVLPQAGFDTSLTARWGYRPTPVSDFLFGTAAQLGVPQAARAFGSSAAVLARDNEDGYRRAQALIGSVIRMAGERGIRAGIGFEFGIWPPELMSVVPQDTYLPGVGLPDPTCPASREIQQATIDDILRAYPAVDSIWLWLHEHTMKVPQAAFGGEFRALLDRDRGYFPECGDAAAFTGTWSLEFIRQAYDYLSRRRPGVRLVISGWGGGDQLAPVLKGLHQALPPAIIFSCLNGGGGAQGHAPVLAGIARERKVWAIPWLESDSSLWHPQPGVGRLRDQVLQARRDGLDGVFAIHWRTREMRYNLRAFARFAREPGPGAPGPAAFYAEQCGLEFGPVAGPKAAALLLELEQRQLLLAGSPEFYPYDPGWGRLDPAARPRIQAIAGELRQLAGEGMDPRARTALDDLAAECEFVLLLDEVGRGLEPARMLKDRRLLGVAVTESERRAAEARLLGAPVERLFHAYARRVRSRGEMGVLSSLNQKLGQEYRELRTSVQSRPGAD